MRSKIVICMLVGLCFPVGYALASSLDAMGIIKFDSATAEAAAEQPAPSTGISLEKSQDRLVPGFHEGHPDPSVFYYVLLPEYAIV